MDIMWRIIVAGLLVVGAWADAPMPLLIETAGQRTLISPWGSDSLRLQAVPAGAEFSDALGALLPRKLADARTPESTSSVTNGNIRAEVDKSGRFKVTRVSDGKQLFTEGSVRQFAPRASDAAHSQYSNSKLFSVKASVAVGSDERHYGLGQHQSGSLKQNGNNMPFNQANTRVFIPFVVSSRQYGYLMNYPGVGNLKWQHQAAMWTMEASAQFDVWVTTTSSNGSTIPWPAQITSKYADATGHSPVLPEWATGLWQSKNRYQTQEELLDVVKEHRKRNLPLSVIVADYFSWSPSYTLGDYKFDKTCWPDPKGLIDQLESWNVKFMVSPYSNFINNRSENYAAAKAAGDLFAVDKHGHAITGFQHSAVYDVYNEKTRKFMGERIRDTYLKQGLRVVWHDCDEWCSDSGPGSGAGGIYYPSVGTADAVASAYPGKLAQTWSEAFLQNGVTDGIQLGRSAWAGTQRFGAAVWSGDIGSDWGSLAMSISAGQSIGLSGIPWWTTDVGGYGGSHGAMNTDDPKARELMVRWVQFGAFCPLFRIHGYRKPTMSPTCAVCVGYSCDQSHETAAWAYGETAYDAIEKMIHKRESIRPYINDQMKEVAKIGVPFMRPVWFEFPGDATAMTSEVEDTQFMAGGSILVAPVTKLGAREKNVYFPSGAHWRHLFTNVTYNGGKWATVPAPLDTPPVFMRSKGPPPHLPTRASEQFV